MTALVALSEHIIRGRWNDVREPTELEMKQTTVLSLTLEEASAKIRTGPPLDDEEDYSLPMWAIPKSTPALRNMRWRFGCRPRCRN